MVERDSAAPAAGAAHEAGQEQGSLYLCRIEGRSQLEPGASFESKNGIPEEVRNEQAAVGSLKSTWWAAKARPLSHATESRALGAVGDLAADVIAYLHRSVSQGGDGQLSIEDAAGALALSVRTLQRRLAEVGLRYSLLRDWVRMEEACRMIVNSDAQLIDVAYHVGFSDPGHFTRAFQRWTGMAPRHFRRRVHARKDATQARAQ